MSDLVAEGLTMRFGGLTALNKASMQVDPGEIHALIGPNGAGKSTLVNIVTGFGETPAALGVRSGLPLQEKLLVAGRRYYTTGLPIFPSIGVEYLP